ncbi:MAG: NACHT domain-containing protein [Sandaracinaceae bacterium]|nr:NACHT domain-containing protein [Sandaracinaceae bacterium]
MERSERERRTFGELQRLEAGRFHALGDQLLPRLYPQLRGLRPYGKNTDGKSRKGHPDSFVGTSAKDCTIAVEYTTQQDRLIQKLRRDQAGVRRACPKAQEIFLVASGEIPASDRDGLNQRLANDTVVRIVDGWELASELALTHQDLRRSFLDIPIDAHSIESLTEQLREQLEATLDEPLRNALKRGVVSRPRATDAVLEASMSTKAAAILIAGSSGSGKTTWSASLARSLAGNQPCVWLPAKELHDGPDPISLQVVQHAYGEAEASRITELADLLRRDRGYLLVWLDGIDEVNDYERLRAWLKSFRLSRLWESTRLVLTCREPTHLELEERLRVLHGPDDAGAERRGTLRLDPIGEEERRRLLRCEGASEAEIRSIEVVLPPDDASPLLLRTAFELLRSGTLPADSRVLIGARCDLFRDDIVKRSRKGGRRYEKHTVERSLARVAWSALERGGWADVSAIDGIPDAGACGESTFLGWAEQSGLVVRRGAQIGFTHPAFAEELAARYRSGESEVAFERLGGLPLRVVRTFAPRIAPRLHDPTLFLERLAQCDLRSAMEAAAECGDLSTCAFIAPLLERIAAELIRSRFDSDVRDAVRALGRVQHPEARRRILEWYCGLCEEDRTKWRHEAAEALLEQQETGEPGPILRHRHLNHAIGWYEPSFVQRIRALPAALAGTLAEEAQRILADADRGKPYPAGPVQFLAMLKADSLLEHLRRALSARPLAPYEHRALIFLNSAEGIALYARSVEKIRASWAEGEWARWNAPGWSDIVGLGADIPMFPHDQLVEHVKQWLSSSDPALGAIGGDWAARLADPELAIAHCKAHGGFSAPLAENLVRRFPFPVVREVLDRCSSEVTVDEVLRAVGAVRATAAEGFVLEKLRDARHAMTAAQVAGALRVVGAAPELRRIACDEGAEVWARHSAIEALGELRYRPALVDLERLLDEDADAIVIIGAIGAIGGDDAWTILEHAANEHNAEYVLGALLGCRDPDVLQYVKRLAQRLGSRAFVEGLRWSRLGRFESVDPWVGDADLLSAVWNVVREDRASAPEWFDARRAVQLLAHFDHPRVLAILHELAGESARAIATNTDVADELERSATEELARRGDPAMRRKLVDQALDRKAPAECTDWCNLPPLLEHEPSVARQALLARLGMEPESLRWTWLLAQFAGPEDQERFRELEQSPVAEVADAAHRWLVDQGLA